MQQHSGSYRQSHQGHGRSYQHELDSMRYQRISWMLEKQVLERVLEEKCRSCLDITYLDFACGTGRIISFVEQFVASSTGIDISDSMLEVAKSNVAHSYLLHGDLTRADYFEPGSFDLITAFRFFARAEPELRRSALQTLLPLLKEDGWLVFNNHVRCEHHRAPLRNLFRRLVGRKRAHCMSDEEIETIFSESGFRMVKVIPVGLLSPRLRLLVPSGLLCRLDSWLASFRFFARRAQIKIYVCSRATGSLQV